MSLHKPVLLNEAITYLNCRPGGFYVDCTLGMAGHSRAILNASSPDGFLLGLDRDEEAIRIAVEQLKQFEGRFQLVHRDYRMLTTVLEENSFRSPVGILADLGPSLLHFTSPERGFSFQTEGPLDMRMDRSQGETAADIVNSRSVSDLARVFRQYGEENAALKLAKKIVEQRPIHTTAELSKLVESVKPRRREDKIHPATKTFQALRIVVNQELENLDTFVFDAFDVLADGGRLVVIAFHSLEDRVIKHCFQFLSADCRCPKRLLECRCGGSPLSKMLTRKPVEATEAEVNENPASRSAKLRAIEKIAGQVPRELWPEYSASRR